MASIGPSGAIGGRRKSLDAEINLVPFIDLLSMCICFLLMTAIWMEVGALQVKQMTGTEAAETKSSYEMDLRFFSPRKMELAIKNGNKPNRTFSVEGDTAEARLTQLDTILKGLGPVFKLDPSVDIKAQMNRLFSVAKVTTKAGVPYGELVSVMDILRNNGIVNLGVVPVRE